MKTYLIVILLLIRQWSIAQQNMQLHTGASIKVHNSGQLSVFGNIDNAGLFDFSATGSVYFYGTTWTNNATASLGTGTGGVAIFAQPNTLYGTNLLQHLDAGGAAIPFPNLSMENANHLQLINTDSKIRSTLSFNNGSLILNNQNLTVGDGNPGTIQQYDETKFVVTNANHLASSGFLIREQVTTSTDFPIGIALGDYTPARISNSGIIDDFRVRVFENVYTNGINGSLQNDASVGRTWEIEEATIGGSNVLLDLQHNSSTEGINFSPSTNYVARYIGIQPNNIVALTDSKWDYVGLPNCATNITPANITTGATVVGAARNLRNNFTNFTDYRYYTTSTCSVNVLPIQFKSIRIQERSDCSFELIWETLSEQNVAYFEVEGSFDGVHFESLDLLSAKQQAALYTFIVHKNIADKTYYLRLKTVDADFSTSYSTLVAHRSSEQCLPDPNSFYQVYPNPTNQQQVFIKINHLLQGSLHGTFEITDVLGRNVLEIPTVVHLAQPVYQLDISSLIAGTYFIKYTLNHETYFPIKKLIVTK